MRMDEKRALRDALRALGPHGTELNRARKYPAFGIMKGSGFRIAVHVGAKGTTFFTEDKDLLAALAAKGMHSHECDQSKTYNKRRYVFPDLTISQVHNKDNQDSFSKLVHDSVSIKEQGL